MSRAERVVLLAASVVLGIALGQKVLLLVAAGAAWQVFAGGFPPHPSRTTTAYFLAVLTMLGLVMWLMPGQGFGSQ